MMLQIRPEQFSFMIDASRRKFVDDFLPTLRTGAALAPSTWTKAKRAECEEATIEKYTALRRATDSAERAAKLARQNRSSAPGSLSFPE